MSLIATSSAKFRGEGATGVAGAPVDGAVACGAINVRSAAAAGASGVDFEHAARSEIAINADAVGTDMRVMVVSVNCLVTADNALCGTKFPFDAASNERRSGTATATAGPSAACKKTSSLQCSLPVSLHARVEIARPCSARDQRHLSGVPVIDMPFCDIHCLCDVISVLVAGRPFLTHLPFSSQTPSGDDAPVVAVIVSVVRVVSLLDGTGVAGGDICAWPAVATNVAATARIILFNISFLSSSFTAPGNPTQRCGRGFTIRCNFRAFRPNAHHFGHVDGNAGTIARIGALSPGFIQFAVFLVGDPQLCLTTNTTRKAATTGARATPRRSAGS
jgi:hypothetical protein